MLADGCLVLSRPAMLGSGIVYASASNFVAIARLKPYARRWKPRAALQQLQITSGDGRKSKSSAISDSLRLLEWDKVCDLVSSFAGTPLGREAAKAQLLSTTDLSYEDSKRRLEETSAAIELINYGADVVDFAGIDVMMVKSAVDQASRGFHVNGLEAMAVVSLIELAGNLKIMVEAVVKDDADWYNRFMPLAQMIMSAHICNPLVKLVQQVVDEDGTVKDSASSELKRRRDQVHSLERKLYHLMDKLARNDGGETTSMVICNIDGRWCLKSVSSQLEKLDALLLSSGSGHGNLIEPIAAVPLNDELQQTRALVAKAEEDVLSMLTDKMRAELGSIQNLLEMMIQLDAVAARARYSIEYGATYPSIFWSGEIKSLNAEGGFLLKRASNKASPSHHLNEWKLYMRKAYHPLLLQQYRENLERARKAFTGAVSDVKRKRFQGKNITADSIEPMEHRVLQLERDSPMPVDFVISVKTSVVVITGPNTGGKTISLKTVGLASLMSKAGLYVLAAEPVKVPWFDAVYADIGDEQSLTQSLSTFSGHLKQISAIRSSSTTHSLVLLDEVGAGTNPLEGTALGMSILESFAENGAFLSMATTHHGELKTLKYSNHAFENACVEFDEESLKPTYRILWGIPGISNAINIAEKLGLPLAILSNARKLHGKSSAEINEIIVDLESSKQDFQQNLQKAEHYLVLSRKLHQDLLMARQRVDDHCSFQIAKKAKAVSDMAAMARSILRRKLQQCHESSASQTISQSMRADDSDEPPKENLNFMPSAYSSVNQTKGSDIIKPSQEKLTMPEVGEKVFVPSLGKEAVVLKVEAFKGEILVQANNFKLRVRLSHISPRCK